VASIQRAGLSWWAYCGVALWLVAVVGESVADRELAAHRADPSRRGATCRSGLWRYSRHPNYFFEWLHWWTYVIIAAGAPWWWVALAGPAVMTFFLFKVTGIPATEAQALATRGDDYRDYQRTTSVFVPWFPKR
jgi:steroid 5-alpha reductase family enzyme